MSHHAPALRGSEIFHNRNHWDGGHVNDPGSGEPGNDHAEPRQKLADIECVRRSPSHATMSSGEATGNRRRKDAHDRERRTNHGLAPRVAIDGVERPNNENFVRDVSEKLQRRQFGQFRMTTQQRELTRPGSPGGR